MVTLSTLCAASCSKSCLKPLIEIIKIDGGYSFVCVWLTPRYNRAARFVSNKTWQKRDDAVDAAVIEATIIELDECFEALFLVNSDRLIIWQSEESIALIGNALSLRIDDFIHCEGENLWICDVDGNQISSLLEVSGIRLPSGNFIYCFEII